MAQHFNISIEDVQRLCSADGQSLRFVVGDINNGGNGAQQIIYTVPQNNPPALFPHQTINLATPLDQRPNVYIIKTSEQTAAQSIIKANTVATHLVTENVNFIENKDTKVPTNNAQEAQQSPQWVNVQENKISIDSVLKTATPLKTQPKPQQQNNLSTVLLHTQGHCSQPDLQVYGSMDKKGPRAYQNKAKIPGASPGIASTPGLTARPASGDHIVNPATRFPSTTLTRAKLSLQTDANQVSRGVRAVQACTPITRNAPPILQRSLGKNLSSCDLDQLSERIKREKLKQAQMKQEQMKQEQLQNEKQVIYRTPQKTPIITQRPAAVQRTPQFQSRQVTPRLQNPGQLTPRPMQNRMVVPTQQGLMNVVRPEQRRIVVNSPRQKAPMTSQRATVPQTTPVQSEQILQIIQGTAEVQEKGRMTQQSCTPKSDTTENNSSESYAYLQRVIENPQTAIVQHQISGNVAKMLVVLLDGEQRLITFDIPAEDCTVQDLLEQVNVSFGSENIVSLVNDPTLGINYIVEVQQHGADSSNEHNDSKQGSQLGSKNCVRSSSPNSSLQYDENSNSSTSQIEEPKYVEGMVAVCPHCGVLSTTFNQCERCKRKMPTNVKSVSDSFLIKGTKDIALSCDTFYKKVDHPLPKLEKVERESTPTRGRGRGRGGVRTRRPVKEPECLIISSDEEHENEKSAKLDETSNRAFLGSQEGMNSEESELILEKEPVITNQSATASEGIKGTDRESDDQIVDSPTIIPMQTALPCRTVRIGSYKYIPAENVTISHNGLRLNVPFLEDNKKLVTVDIKYENIVRVLIHFGKAMPVLFFYTTPQTGAMIREVLGMQDPQGPYYDPASKDHTHKRITLLPDKIKEESRVILKTLYDGKLEELNTKEANDILVRASPKDCLQQVMPRRPSTQTTSSNPSSNGVIQTITVYPPPPAKGGIAINTEDYLCLGEDQFLNDVIIDFYLKYLTSEILSETDQNRTHVFSSYFYKRLTSPHASAATDSNMPQTAAAKRHARVQKWTKNVNIFEKDFIVIPINEHAHWFLAIICFPGLVGKVPAKAASAKESEAQNNVNKSSKKLKELKLQAVTIGSTTITPVTTTITIDQADDGSERDEAEGDDEEMEMDSEDDEDGEDEGSPVKQPKVAPPRPTQEKSERLPCILIFDSLAGASRCRVVATLRDYLFCEHIAKEGTEKIFSKDTIKGASPKVPQQSNFTDCGVYVLQYVESFFKDPIKDYTLPIKTLKTWFEEIVVTRKREEISKLLIELMKKTKSDKTINLPSVSFPTQDGKLKPKSETEKTEKTEKTSKSEDGKKKETEIKVSVAAENSEPQEQVVTEVTSRNIPLIPYSSTSSSSCSSTEGNVPELSAEVIPPVRSSAETMHYLKSKRIQRIVMKSDNSDEKPAAKKLKSDNADSCK